MRYLVVLCIFITGCKLLAPNVIFPKYTLENHIDSKWLDLRDGEWVLYDVDAPTGVRSDLEQKANEELSALVPNFVSLTSQDMLIEKNIVTFDKEQLMIFKEDLSSDYLIFIKALEENAETFQNIERELDAYGNNEFEKKNYYSKKVSTKIDIYDLNQQTLVYSKTATGLLYTEEANQFKIHTSIDKMFQKTLDMLLDDIKEESYHK